MPAYRTALDAARAIVEEKRASLAELTIQLTEATRAELPDAMVAELDDLAARSQPEAESAEAYRTVEKTLVTYEVKLRKALDLAAQIRGARERGERIPTPGRAKRIVVALGAAAMMAGVVGLIVSAWRTRAAESEMADGAARASASWGALRVCLVGDESLETSATNRLRAIELGLDPAAPSHSESWPQRCATFAGDLARSAAVARLHELEAVAMFVERELAAGKLTDPQMLWSRAATLSGGLPDPEPPPPPPARPPPPIGLETPFGLPGGTLTLEPFPGDVLRFAARGDSTTHCELEPAGTRCSALTGWKWLDFAMGPRLEHPVALAGFGAEVAVLELPTRTADGHRLTSSSGAMSGAYVSPSAEVLSLVQTPLEAVAASVLLQAAPDAPPIHLSLDIGPNDGPALVWDDVIVLRRAASGEAAPSLEARAVDLAARSIGEPVRLGELLSPAALDEAHGPGRSWSWISSCRTDAGRFLIVAAVHPRSAIRSPDAPPVRIVWRGTDGWGELLEVPEGIPIDVLDRVACEGSAATWTGLGYVESESPTASVWQVRCNPTACEVERSPPMDLSRFAPLGDIERDVAAHALVALGEEVVLVELESKPSRFGAGSIETVWMRRTPLAKLATAQRVRLTDSLAVGRELRGVEIVARPGHAYLLLTAREGRAAIAIDREGGATGLRSLP